MKLKTIKRTIKSKMDEWIKSLPKELRADVLNNIIVTGGSIASMLLKDQVKDYDIYFKESSVLLKVAQHYIGNQPDVSVDIDDDDDNRVRIFIKSTGARKYDDPEGADKEKKYRLVYLTENAITLSDQIQIVTRFTGLPDKIHENYDFAHATNYWTYETGLVVNEKALVSLLTRELFYSGSKYPICSIIRTRKFIKKGFTINAGQYLKMCLQVSELNLRDVGVLRDQLIGVDSAYFEAFIACINNKIEKEGLEAITETYLFNLIDFIFDNQDNDEEGEANGDQ